MADNKDFKTPTAKEILSKDNGSTVSDNLDSLFKSGPLGKISSGIGDTFYGLNHRKTPAAIQMNKDDFGYTFFTRPRLNLTTGNLEFIREMTPLLSAEKNSIPRIIRSLLDPTLIRNKEERIECDYVDSQNVFIPVLTNNLLSIAGWPDRRVLYTTSHEGIYKESYSIIDGPVINNSTYDITASFRNIPGNPIAALFDYWIQYASYVYEGRIIPYMDAIRNNEIDYNTRIYRLVMDSTRTFVTNIAACGASFPVNSGIASTFDYEVTTPLNMSSDRVEINFVCTGAIYNDPILIKEFNRSVGIFNQAMESKQTRDSTFRKVSPDLLTLFNYRGYPRIDPYTYELEWYVDRAEYDTLSAAQIAYQKTLTKSTQP